MKVLFHACLFCIFFTLWSTKNVSAKPVTGESILCENKGLFTMIALSTESHNVAICKEFGDAYHYIGQSKQDNAQIFLPIREINNPYTGANPRLLKARNGEFTYQVAEFNPFNEGSYVSVSVFENGHRIYHHITDTYITAGE